MHVSLFLYVSFLRRHCTYPKKRESEDLDPWKYTYFFPNFTSYFPYSVYGGNFLNRKLGNNSLFICDLRLLILLIRFVTACQWKYVGFISLIDGKSVTNLRIVLFLQGPHFVGYTCIREVMIQDTEWNQKTCYLFLSTIDQQNNFNNENNNKHTEVCKNSSESIHLVFMFKLLI